VLARVLASKSLDGAPVLLMANKQDLPEAQSPHDVAENLTFEVHGRGDGRPTKIVPACAFTGEGLKEGLEWLVAMIKSSPRTTSIRLRNVKH
jgi:ADP-ribosylation factor related protein 1